jgi:hypothetical protein
MLIFMAMKVLENSLGYSRLILISDYYRYQIALMVLVGAVNLLVSLWLVQEMGILGVALGTGAALLVFSLGKFIIMYWGLKLNPYTPKSLYVLGLGVVIYLAQWPIALPGAGWASLLGEVALRSLVIAGGFTGIVYWARWSPQFNGMIDGILKQAKRYWGR